MVSCLRWAGGLFAGGRRLNDLACIASCFAARLAPQLEGFPLPSPVSEQLRVVLYRAMLVDALVGDRDGINRHVNSTQVSAQNGCEDRRGKRDAFVVIENQYGLPRKIDKQLLVFSALLSH